MAKKKELGDSSTYKIPYEINIVEMQHRNNLANNVLLGIFILFIVAGIFLFIDKKIGESVFDGFIKILPPIATLVLGYYFSKK